MSQAKHTRTMLMMFASLTLALLLLSSASAATLEVGTCRLPGNQPAIQHFSTIQAAVNAASPGDTVLVCPGTYPEQVTIAKNLTLSGLNSGNAGSAVVVPPPTGLVVLPPDTVTAPQVFVDGTNGGVTQVVVSDLTVDAANNLITSCTMPPDIEAVYFLNASGTIENVLARNQNVKVNGLFCGTGIGLRVTGNTVSSVVTVQNNTVSAYDESGIFASLPMAQTTIRNNSILGPGSSNTSTTATGITLFDDVMATVSGNFIADNTNGLFGQNGIDVVGVNGAVISKNVLGNNGVGIAFYTFTGDPNSDNGTVTDNQVFGGDLDGIAICGSNNQVTGNIVSNFSESGVNLVTNWRDAECVGNNNTVTGNSINGACAAALVDPATNGNTIGPNNKAFNTEYLRVPGTTCPPAEQPSKKGSLLGARFSKLEK